MTSRLTGDIKELVIFYSAVPIEDPTDWRIACLVLCFSSFLKYIPGAGDLVLDGSVKGCMEAFLPIRFCLVDVEPNY